MHLDSAGRRLFALTAGEPRPGIRGVLICPAFAEEMNRSRQTVRLLLNEVGDRGLLAISADLHGTGDSEGEFADARWAQWLRDLESAAGWLLSQGCTAIALVGIRAGGLLAWDLLRQNSLPLRRLVLWQPVLNGKALVTDVLRTRVAAGLQREPRETVGDLRRRLSAGEAIESAGYALHSELAQALEHCDILPPTSSANSPPIHWLEIVAEENSTQRQSALDAIARLQDAGLRVEASRSVDPPFWSTQEITVGRTTARMTAELLAA